jgi:hypothetical protein
MVLMIWLKVTVPTELVITGIADTQTSPSPKPLASAALL